MPQAQLHRFRLIGTRLWRGNPWGMLLLLSQSKFSVTMLVGKQQVFEAASGYGTGRPMSRRTLAAVHTVNVEPVFAERARSANGGQVALAQGAESH